MDWTEEHLSNRRKLQAAKGSNDTDALPYVQAAGMTVTYTMQSALTLCLMCKQQVRL